MTLAAHSESGRAECLATIVPHAHARVLAAASSTPAVLSSLAPPLQLGPPSTVTPATPQISPKMIDQLGAPAREMIRSSETIHTLVSATINAATPEGMR